MATHSQEVSLRRHPGSGRKRARFAPRGRQVEDGAREQVRALLGQRSRSRDLLIEHLHLLQDQFGCLRARHLVALADEMRLALAEVYEVATFYAHFDVVEDDAEVAELTVRVCDSLSCEMQGAQALLAALPGALGKKVRVLRAPCMGRCETAPVAEVGHNHICNATLQSITAAAQGADTHPHVGAYADLESCRADGGYALLAECLAGKRTPDELIEIMSDAGLRGLGGAGFPVGRKWSIVRSYPGPRLMALNADEGEPGTFKDRYYLERDPHRFLEGALIGAWVVEAGTMYVYVRDEYPGVRAILEKEVAALEAAGLNPHCRIELRRGAGAYICGEESAMIESIEGKRGLPRNRPPYVAEVGLFGRPTLEQNVETMYWVRDIVEKGAAWYSGQGRNGGRGFRSFSVSGRVREPGVKQAPAGITVRELIDEYCGGMAQGHTFKAYLPGGASGGVLPASMSDLPLEFGKLEEHGCLIGSHADVVLSDKDNMKDVALNLMRYFEDESCGQCTPCRVGTEKVVKLMQQPRWDEPLLRELCAAMTDASICGLGQAAANPLLSVLLHFAVYVRCPPP